MTAPFGQPSKESLQQTSSKFWAGLFDFSFTKFITLKFIRVIYAIVLGVVVLTGLVLMVVSLIGGASNNQLSTVLFGLIVVPLITLFYIIGARLTFEFIAVVFRIGENVARVALASEREAFAEEAHLNFVQRAADVPPLRPDINH